MRPGPVLFSCRSGPRFLARMLLLACALSAAGANAAPFRPTDDDEVLARLPVAQPRGTDDLDAAVGRARAQIELARRSGDPRFLGYAEGLLRPWWSLTDAPAEILLLRATLRQSRHEFTAALHDLDRLLAREADHPQALLTQASVLRVQGRLAPAAQACRRLRRRAATFVAELCWNAVRGLAGERKAAADALDRLVPDSARQGAAIRAWFAAERADLADRAGDAPRALAIHAAALGTGLDDPQTRAAAIDVLLQLGRAEAALQFAGHDPVTDALRLRAAIAARVAGKPRLDLELALADSFAAARARGDGAHLREEARYALEVRRDPARALALARENWRTQREPADALLLAAAARAAGQPGAADPVREFVAASGLEDARLERLLQPPS